MVIKITIVRSISFFRIRCFRIFLNIKYIFHLILVAHICFGVVVYRSSSMEVLGLVF